MTDLIERLGERIRLMRITKGLSREKLSELSGINSNYIGQVERGEKNPTIETLHKLVAGLNSTLEELFRYIEPADKKDVLSEIVEQLSSRPISDQHIALQLLRTIFEWEEKKWGKT